MNRASLCNAFPVCKSRFDKLLNECWEENLIGISALDEIIIERDEPTTKDEHAEEWRGGTRNAINKEERIRDSTNEVNLVSTLLNRMGRNDIRTNYR